MMLLNFIFLSSLARLNARPNPNLKANDIAPLHVEGKNFVDPSGNVVHLRGCNLGNWLMIERWMLGLDDHCGFTDQTGLFRTLDERFGRPERERLIDLYRDTWIRDSDFDTIKSYRFNVVRLPMDYRLFEDDANPMHLRPNAFKWVDRCVDMATKHGIYVILDLHGVQGGQSTADHTGASDKNKFWTDANDQARAAWLWTKIAAHYRANPDVIAYDPMNEPYGGTHAQQKLAYPMLYRAIRQSDPEKLVYFHGNYDGFRYYGDPKAQGFHNVGIQMHYYPGLFGGGNPTVATHAAHLASLKAVASVIDSWQVPFLVGEMNPVFASVGIDMMRRTYDVQESYGWTSIMWSYKLATPAGGFDGGSWGMVSNHSPMPQINFQTASLSEIEAWIRNLGTMRWDVYEALRQTMAPEKVVLKPLPVAVRAQVVSPQGPGLPNWVTAEVGGAIPGGIKADADGTIHLFGGGADIWAEEDQFRYLYQQVTGDFELSVTVDRLNTSQQYAKAGLMIRDGLATDAPNVFEAAFPEGALQFSERKSAGDGTEGQPWNTGSLPVTIRIVRKGAHFSASFQRASGGGWQMLSETDRPDLPAKLDVGLVACSHDNDGLVEVDYHGLQLQQ